MSLFVSDKGEKMRKIKKILLLCFFAITLISCDSKKDNNIKVAMVSDIGSIDDKSFNQNTWEGIVKYAKENNLPRKNYTFANSPTKEDYIVNLSNFADEHFDLIIACGYYFEKHINIVGSKYPNQNFLLIDAIAKTNKNVLSITFNSNEGSFLVGVAAALKANEMGLNKVGFLGGVDEYLVQAFEAGFVSGVEAVNPNIKVFIEYANDFANPMKGQQIASKMYDKGVNIIFNVAGSTGNGLIKEAKKRAKMGDDVWVIGVDKDQYKEGIYEKEKSVILTSMIKRVDIATYDTIKLVKNGKFKGGHKIYGLKSKGVSLPSKNPNLKNEWLKVIQKYKDEIINGKIVISKKPKRIKDIK